MRKANFKLTTLAGAAAATVALLPGVALSNDQDNDQGQQNQQATEQSHSMTGSSEDIITMDQEDLYQKGISVDSLLGGDVVDSSENQVGSVEDLVLGADDNNVSGLIVASGGFLGIGENHLLFPFEKANIKESDRIQANISKSTAGELSLFKELEGQPLQGGRTRASEIIGSLAYTDGEPYGRVDDLIIDRSGNILAVVVQADVMYGDNAYHAWPFADYYDEATDVYDVPKDERHRFGEEPFDATSLKGASQSSSQS